MMDVVYAGLAQLSYLNWHNLPEIKDENDSIVSKLVKKYFKDLKNGDYEKIYIEEKAKQEDKIIEKDKKEEENCIEEKIVQENGEKKKVNIYDSRDARIFMLYSEDKVEQKPKYKEIGECKFICGYDHKKIYNELEGKVLSDTDCGFQASAFKSGETIIIAYRGSDDMADKYHRRSDWYGTNFSLGFNIMPDALICAVWMYNKVKSMNDTNAKICITGHSMGGALAQFVTIYSGGEHEMVTWSALGIGEPDKKYRITSIDCINHLMFESVLKRERYLINDKWNEEKCRDIDREELIKIVEEVIETEKNFIPEINTENREKRKKIENPNIKMKLVEELKYKYEILCRYQTNYGKLKDTTGNKYRNFYYDVDLTPMLQEKQGESIEVRRESKGIEFDEKGSGILRKVVALVSENFSRYHGIPMYLPFINNNGMVEPGKLNDSYVWNAVKTLILNDEKYNEDADISMREKANCQKFPEKFQEGIEAYNSYVGSGGSKLPREKLSMSNLGTTTLDLMAFADNLKDRIKEYEKKWYEIKDKYSICGKFVNYNEIGGVIGGKEYTVFHEKIGKNFAEIVEIILPTIIYKNSNINISCDVGALKKHRISYDEKKVLNNIIEVKIVKTENKNNFEEYIENKFGTMLEGEDEEIGIHLGVDFSYGNDNPITCSHLEVYSPVRGIVKEVKNTKVVIEQEVTIKKINGEECNVYYYHSIEHLDSIKVETGERVYSGVTVIGTMGGCGTENIGDEKYRYLQHVHYDIKMEQKYFTGALETKTEYNEKSIKKSDNKKMIFLDPEEFWNNRIEIGIPEFEKEQDGDEKDGK